MGITRRRFIQAVSFAAGGIGTVTLGQGLQGCGKQPQVSKEPEPINLAGFEFDVVTVNAKGEETERRKSEAQSFAEDLGNEVMLEMVSIPGGTFTMGSPEGEEGRNWYQGFNEKLTNVEGPQRQVTVPDFFMGKYPVTQAQWKAVAALPKIERKLDPDLSQFKGDDRPAEMVSWYEAMEFCARLSQATGRKYRLPSEAEWEYACRAGTTTPFHFGETVTTDLANYRGTDRKGYSWSGSYGEGPKGEYRQATTAVGQFGLANSFGLYDMHGNVWEWCADPWHDNYEAAPNDGTIWSFHDKSSFRVKRGGSWNNYPRICRSASRNGNFRVRASNDLGFRVVCAALTS